MHASPPRVAIPATAPFVALLAAFLLLLLALNRPNPSGDFPEYALMTVAIATHGTPDIRPDDVFVVTALAPEPQFAERFARLAKGLAVHAENPVDAFYRAHDGATYSFHFFAYSALAAVPYRVLKALGVAPFKCFQLVNLGFAFIAGLCCLRLFGSAGRAALGVALFFLCGGALYWNWCSPELMSAAGLLSGLILFVTGAPLRAGLLVSVAAMQNPSIVLATAFAPLLTLAIDRARGVDLRSAAAGLLRPRYLAALALMASGALVPVLFNEWKYGVPSVIALAATDTRLIGLVRLRSFFFDLNQGMLIGMPGLFAYLLYAVSGRSAAGTRALLALAIGLSIALALPTLSTGNWNSGAAGMMRYAFWAAMPLLFAALLFMRGAARLAVVPLALLMALQLAAGWQARRYDNTQFSSIAQLAMTHAPRWYNPASEIFVERLLRQEVVLDPARVYAWPAGGTAVKTLFHAAGPNAASLLCGAGVVLSPHNDITGVDAGWAYVNGPVLCERGL